MPTLRSLRRAWPDAEVTLIGLPWAEEYVRRFNHYVDCLLPFPGFPGIREAPLDAAASALFLGRAQARPFDLAVQLHGNGVNSNPFVALLGARRCAGLYVPGHFCPDPDLFAVYPEQGSEVQRLLAVPRHLGLPAEDACLEFPLLPKDEDEYACLAKEFGLAPGEYVCLHAGARDPRRRWEPALWAEVASGLAGLGVRVVLTGSAEERVLADSLFGGAVPDAVNLCGRTSLGSLACLLANSALLVANDTGVSHLAAALGVPSVIVFSGSDPDRWAPNDVGLHRVLVAPGLRTRKQARPASAPAVLEEAEALLQVTSGRRAGGGHPHSGGQDRRRGRDL